MNCEIALDPELALTVDALFTSFPIAIAVLLATNLPVARLVCKIRTNSILALSQRTGTTFPLSAPNMLCEIGL